MKDLLLFALLCLFACQPEAGFSDPLLQPEADFKVRISTNFPGLVRFSNTSVGMNSFHWDFGFRNADGTPASSRTAHPIVTFPANGHYRIRLSAKTRIGEEFSTEQQIGITNY